MFYKYTLVKDHFNWSFFIQNALKRETRLLLAAGEDLKLHTKTCNPPSH